MGRAYCAQRAGYKAADRAQRHLGIHAPNNMRRAGSFLPERNIYPITATKSPPSTFVACTKATRSTTPSVGAEIAASIFMASIEAI
ncbi:hypothetical protein SAMN04488535_2026 [Corynebacterium mycetoides]|uniref:Uncharacterized protein n=1 Tax=Corynebacterium mycetoides TaxID=38302 RepID=A0A1G9QPC7_9CORY|nr:hypothetical protein SAMN04488535_2026 [Corynebacterium mycetoides]